MLFVKLPLLHRNAEECTTLAQQWIFILKNLEKMEKMPTVFMENPVFLNLEKKMRLAGLPDDERKQYQASLKAYRDANAVMAGSREIGFREGLEKGLEKGKMEAAINIARNLKAKNFASEEIINLTGLTPDQIKSL